MTCTIYSITHLESGREYIGITSRAVAERWRNHIAAAARGVKTHIASAIRKYTPAAFAFRVEAGLPNFELAKLAEMALIARRKPALNMSSGGDGARGFRRSLETRAKIAAAKIGNTSRAGQKHTEETKAKMRAKRALQAPLSEEARARISAANRHYRHTDEARARIAESLKGNLRSVGRKDSEETLRRKSEAGKARWSRAKGKQ